MAAMMAQLGGTGVAVNDGPEGADQEELQLLQPYETHMSELAFTDPFLKMWVL